MTVKILDVFIVCISQHRNSTSCGPQTENKWTMIASSRSLVKRIRSRREQRACEAKFLPHVSPEIRLCDVDIVNGDGACCFSFGLHMTRGLLGDD